MEIYPFDKKHRNGVEFGEFLVVTENTHTSVKILDWDGGNNDYPVIGIDDDGIVSNYSITGKNINREQENLILVDAKRELTEIEKLLLEFGQKLTGRLIKPLDPDVFFGKYAKKIVLKIYKDHSQWKPSKKQMEALKEVCVYMMSTNIGACLCELYKELKRL